MSGALPTLSCWLETSIKAQYALGRQAGDQLTADRLYPPIAEGVAYKALARHFLSGRYSIGNAWDWTADGKIIISADVRAGRHEVQLINATTGEPIDMFARDEDSIYNLDISPDAQRIAVSNEKPKVVEILDANGGKPIKTLDGWEGASNLFFSPDNRWLAMSDGGHFGIVDTQSWNVKTWNGSIPPGNLVFSSNSLYVAFVSDSGQPTIVSLGDEVSSYQGDAGPIGGSPYSCLRERSWQCRSPMSCRMGRSSLSTLERRRNGGSILAKISCRQP